MLDVVALDLDHAIGPGRARARSTAFERPRAARWLSLIEHRVRQRVAVVAAATGAHRGPLQRRAGLAASCACRRCASCRARPATYRRVVGGDTREQWHMKFSATRSPVRIGASGPSHRAERRPGDSAASPSRTCQRTTTRRVELPERLGRRSAVPASTPSARADELGTSRTESSTDARRRGEIAEDPDDPRPRARATARPPPISADRSRSAVIGLAPGRAGELHEAGHRRAGPA